MRLAIDVSALSGGLRTGTAVYVYRLVEALAALPDSAEIRLLYNGMPGEGADLTHALEGPRVRAVCAYLLWRPLPAPLFWRPYPARLAREVLAADVFHVGEFVYPTPRAGLPVVATVHDVTTKLFPRWHGWPNRILHHRRLGWIARHATRVIVDAAATRAETSAQLGIPVARLDVVPLARGMPPVGAGAAREEVRRAFGLGDVPYVLTVGTLEPRKNLVRLVEAFLRTPASAGVRLVLAGSWGWHTGDLRRRLRCADAAERVTVTGPVDEATLGALYAGARLFAYPSLYEGFGLPVLEAMAAGVPVLTSRGGALEEVAGAAASLVDPTDVASIADGLRVLLESDAERSRLRALGLARERAFTWERTAARTLEVYQRAAREAS